MTATPWLFAAAAVAWVVWSSRRPAAVALPPLVPGAALPPLAAPAAPAPGVSPLLLGAILLPWGLLAFSHLGAKPAPGPAPEPTPASGLDLRGKFVGPHAAEDAAITAEITGQLVDLLKYDPVADINKDGKPDGARLDTGTKIAEARAIIRAYRTSGVSIGDRQPLARDAIAEYLDKAVGNDGGPVDDAARQRWIDGLLEVQKQANRAIGR